MWTREDRSLYERNSARYPSDLTDDEWALMEELILPAKHGGRSREVDVHEMNGVLYVLETHLSCRFLLAVDSLGLRRSGSSSQIIIQAQDFPKQVPRHGNLRQLEHDVATMADNLGTDLHQFFPQCRQRPMLHFFRQGQRPQEVGQMVGQRSDRVLYESVLDGGDIIISFDAAGTDRDVIDLDVLFDELGVATADRAARLNVETRGNTHTLLLDTTDDGAQNFDIVVATVTVIDGNVLDIDQDTMDVQYGSL